ncbi:putative RNA-directed DNA polymerase [Helianthus annuus]|nr:putative RNA-directed DNA polymerase [Helianthus annuus]
MADNKLHPAVTVSNIKHFVYVTLDNDAADYNMWSELFRIHCTAFLVADHLEPRPTKDTSSSSTEKQTTSSPTDSWERLDAIVLQWIYGTISQGLLKTIIKKGTTAYDAWVAIKNLFQDNKATRALHLKQQFANTRLENFSSMNEYCQTLKVLADQLSNVDAAVDEQDLVLQTLAGLTEQYETVGTILQNTKPLPSFVEVRSQLCMNETTKANQAMHSANKAATALHVHSPSSPATPSSATPTHSDPMRGRPKTRGRGRGRSSSSQSTRPRSQNNQYPQPNHPYIIFPNNWASTQWANFQNNLNRFSPQQSNPPCPYPSTPRSNTSQGILGPHPAQAHVATYSPTPTDIAQALYTLSMSQPTDPIGYMDTGATGHMEQPGPQDQGSNHSMQ